MGRGAGERLGWDLEPGSPELGLLWSASRGLGGSWGERSSWICGQEGHSEAPAGPAPSPAPCLRTLARLLSRSGRLMSGTVTEGLNSCGREEWSQAWQAWAGTVWGGLHSTHIQQGARVHTEAVAG